MALKPSRISTFGLTSAQVRTIIDELRAQSIAAEINSGDIVVPHEFEATTRALVSKAKISGPGSRLNTKPQPTELTDFEAPIQTETSKEDRPNPDLTTRPYEGSGGGAPTITNQSVPETHSPLSREATDSLQFPSAGAKDSSDRKKRVGAFAILLVVIATTILLTSQLGGSNTKTSSTDGTGSSGKLLSQELAATTLPRSSIATAAPPTTSNRASVIPSTSTRQTTASTTRSTMSTTRVFQVTRPDGWIALLSVDPYSVEFEESVSSSPPGFSRLRITIEQPSLPSVQTNSSLNAGRTPPTMSVNIRLVVGGEVWNDLPSWIGPCYTSFGATFGLFTCDLANTDRPWGKQSFQYDSADFPEEVVRGWIQRAKSATLNWEYTLYVPGSLNSSCSIYLNDDRQISGPFRAGQLDPKSWESCPKIEELYARRKG